jgi:uncharacterized protein (TIGR03000 family)
MYSVVVLLALTGGSEVPEYPCGYTSYSPSYSCSSYCYSSYSCSSYSYSSYCCPTYCYTPCRTVVTCGPVYYYSCPPIIITHPKKEEKKEKKDKDGKDKDGKEEETSTRATIVVSLPADATLTIDGAATVSTSARRVFSSPALEAGKDFTYVLKAQVMQEGKPLVVEKKIIVRSGETTEVTLTPTPEGVTSR